MSEVVAWPCEEGKTVVTPLKFIFEDAIAALLDISAFNIVLSAMWEEVMLPGAIVADSGRDVAACTGIIASVMPTIAAIRYSVYRLIVIFIYVELLCICLH